jgi:GntR family transcriptional regulator/MocR family aminotransferase
VGATERPGTLAESTGVSPFQISVPAIDIFPRAAWLKISQRILRDRTEVSQLIDDVQGYHALRTAICGYLNVARGIRCGPHQVFITGGYRQSLSLLISALVPSRSAIWIEDPGYPPTSAVLEGFGMRPIPVPVDSEGLDVNEGSQRAAHARMAITTPTKQSPLGVSMSLRRRIELTDWAAETEAWIVEDDYDNEFCFEGKHLPTLHNLDAYGRTFYFGTFSKNLHPNLRIAYVVSPDATIAPLRMAANNMLDGVSILQQKVLAAFIAEGHFALHLKKSRGIAAARRKMVIDALTARFGPRLSICQKSCGLHLFATTNGSPSDVAICQLANERGLGLSNLSSRYIKAEPKHGLLLGYANFSNDAQLSCSIDLLEECLSHFDATGVKQ